MANYGGMHADHKIQKIMVINMLFKYILFGLSVFIFKKLKKKVLIKYL